MAYARFLVVLGVAALVSFILAAFSMVASPGGYALGVTLLLSVAGLQFFRASTSVLSLRAEARKG